MKNPAAVKLGSIKSEKKAATARANGRKGGTPMSAESLRFLSQVDSLGSRNNVLPEDLKRFYALVRRGHIEWRRSDNVIFLTK